MPRRIWNGQGELADDEVYFTKNDGTIVGRPYVRQRAASDLRWLWPGPENAPARAACLARTVDNDEWLAQRNLSLVAAICRDVIDAFYK